MKLRPIQLVCLALLLATLRLADPTALAPGDYALQAGYLNALLSKSLPETRTAAVPQPAGTRQIPAPPATSTLADAALPHASLSTPWTMPHPALHSAALQSFTGFGRPLA